jgi:hypothetical protein
VRTASVWRWRCSWWRALLLGRVARVARVEARAGEVGRVGSGLSVVALVHEGLADGVEHEHWVDGPDAGGEVAAAVVNVGVGVGPRTGKR